ncbi:MAG: hypothetical protein KC656_31325, partial [Myxococcales bacterium]|nr:hypothetical protein [Myxococcales bacterium]
MHLPGRPGCTVVGSPCPEVGWPTDLPAGSVYVAVGGTGAGTAHEPVGTIAEALALVADGGTIALGVGTFDGPVQLARPVTVRGSCAQGTVLTATLTPDAMLLDIDADTTLRDLTLRPVGGMGAPLDGATLVLDQVVVDGFVERAFWLQEATLLADGLLCLDGEAFTPEGDYGRCISAGDGRVQVFRSAFRGMEGLSVFALGETDVDLEDVAVQGRGTVDTVAAVRVIQGDLSARRIWVGSPGQRGIMATEGTFQLEHVVVTGAREYDNGLPFLGEGAGIAAQASTGSIDQAWVYGNAIGIITFSAEGVEPYRVEVRDTFVETAVAPESLVPGGLVDSRSELHAERVRVTGPGRAFVGAGESRLVDVLLASRPQGPDDNPDREVASIVGEVLMERVEIELGEVDRGLMLGVGAFGTPSRVLRDVRIHGIDVGVGLE